MVLDEVRDALLKAIELVNALESIQASGEAGNALEVARHELKRAADAYVAATNTRGFAP